MAPNNGVVTSGIEERLITRIVGVRHDRHAGGSARDGSCRFRRNRLPRANSRGLVERTGSCGVRPGHLAIFELRLGDRRAEVDVPQRRRLELIGAAAFQPTQECAVARRAARVGRWLRRSSTSPPTAPDGATGARRPSSSAVRRAELDEVRTRDRNRLLTRLLRGAKLAAWQRRIAAHAEIVLHAALGR